MKSMTDHFANSPNVRTLCALMTAEIDGNKAALPGYGDWSDADKDIIRPILDDEIAVIDGLTELAASVDSVKGENAMAEAYPTAMQNKATDAITRLNNGMLVLTEAKYLMRFGGKGPFRGMSHFKKRVSGKFLEMANAMLPDHETLASLRVIVTTDQQLPISINHIKSLIDRDDPTGSYSDDGRTYEYVLCSSRSLRKLVDNPTLPHVSTDDYLFFTL